jgi:hypothetical protein
MSKVGEMETALANWPAKCVPPMPTRSCHVVVSARIEIDDCRFEAYKLELVRLGEGERGFIMRCVLKPREQYEEKKTLGRISERDEKDECVEG